MSKDQGELFEVGVLFGPNFIRDHAGQLMTEPRLAVIELVANAYDAGATRVDITWPTERGNEFRIEDNGTGMTKEEFEKRWRTLNYRRTDEQGHQVTFPPQARQVSKRLAFGQSGKGRHSAFCFSDQYNLETWRDGRCTRVTVKLTDGGREPYEFVDGSVYDKAGHGTLVTSEVKRNHISTDEMTAAIGSKFLVEPDFGIYVNRQSLQLLKLSCVTTEAVPVPPFGDVKVHQIDPGQSDRTTHLRGITWWVNRRRVGNPGWDGLDEQGAILDGRRTEAKRYSFVVEADLLKADVKNDWSGFAGSERVNRVQRAVRDYVTRALDQLLSGSRLTRKRQALAETAEALGELPAPSRRAIGRFTEEVIQSCPSITAGDLARTVQVFATMEKARSGYNLLIQLADCSPDDIDHWNAILEKWTASEAEGVLSELYWRLELLSKLERLIARQKADELHDLQPLFERGLWMFGPEYEAVDFRSNRALATVIRDFFKGKVAVRPARRPDFVALADRSIGAYAADSFDAGGDVTGIEKVLVVELKHGGSTLGHAEVTQPEEYVATMRGGNFVQASTRFDVFVLGTFLADAAADERTIGSYLTIRPMRYERLLSRAHARTFHLLEKVKSAFPDVEGDADVEAVVETQGSPLFTQPVRTP